MAIGWLAAFKAVPWPQVIQAAPAVVHSARTLWTGAAPRSGAEPGLNLDERLAQSERRLAQLEAQQAASAEVIQSLAEQNAGLIETVGVLRMRSKVLAGCSGVLAAGLLAVALL